MGFFRIVAILEGVSYLLLLFFAVPLKYIWHIEIYVQTIGMAHGILFMAYVIIIFVFETHRQASDHTHFKLMLKRSGQSGNN